LSGTTGDEPPGGGATPQPPEAWEDEPTAVTKTVDLPIYALSVRQVRQLRLLVAVLAGVIAALVLAFGAMMPRILAYDELFEENMALRGRVSEVDREMSEVDRVMLRLRLYDAQIKGLGGVSGDHGPLPEGDVEAVPEGSPAPAVHPDMEPGAGGPEDLGIEPSDLRPAELWAIAVQARIESFLTFVSLTEPDLNQVVRELEDLHALDEALPSTWPADGLLSSDYGWRRSPFGRTWKFHSGLDIASKRGTPIYAAATGKVIKAEYNEGYGRHVEIDHGFGISSLYGHCNTLEVEVGAKVSRGDFIATMGSTGRSTGPHLHFEVRLDSHPVDPLDYLPR